MVPMHHVVYGMESVVLLSLPVIIRLSWGWLSICEILILHLHGAVREISEGQLMHVYFHVLLVK